MKIEKLPSGSYRIRLQEAGKRYTITVPYKPTEKQAYTLIREKISHPSGSYDSLTFDKAIERYIKNKDAILSPSTIRGYKSMQKNIPDEFKNMELGSISAEDVQKLVNDYSGKHNAKSVHNLHGFVCAVLSTFAPQIELHTTLPKKTPKKAYMPTSDEVNKLLEYAKGSEYYVALCLACSSCRRSEYAAATIDDIHYDKEGNAYLSINKAMVPDENNKYVIKKMPKTESSIRDIPIPKQLLKVILEQGYIYRYNINAVDKYLRTTLPKLGIPMFSVHALRHFYASYMHHLGYSDASIMAAGGWTRGSNVMQKIYIEEMESNKTRQAMSAELSKLF